MPNKALTPLPSFDELLHLAQQAPTELDKLQQKLNLELIEAQETSEGKLALERLLFRMKACHRHCVSPLVRLQRTYGLMMEHMQLMQTKLIPFLGKSHPRPQAAQLLQFPTQRPCSNQEKKF